LRAPERPRRPPPRHATACCSWSCSRLGPGGRAGGDAATSRETFGTSSLQHKNGSKPSKDKDKGAWSYPSPLVSAAARGSVLHSADLPPDPSPGPSSSVSDSVEWFAPMMTTSCQQHRQVGGPVRRRPASQARPDRPGRSPRSEKGPSVRRGALAASKSSAHFEQLREIDDSASLAVAAPDPTAGAGRGTVGKGWGAVYGRLPVPRAHPCRAGFGAREAESRLRESN